MNLHRTTSILQRLPVILAVTAASYGLPGQAQTQRANNGVANGSPRAIAGAPHRLGVYEALSTSH